jgi:predicted TIM-barrel fold metal-dependent hydrolase
MTHPKEPGALSTLTDTFSVRSCVRNSFKSNIYVDTMGPSAIALKAMIEMCGVDRILFGTDFGPVPINPKVHIDLVDETITNSADRNKIFSANTLTLLRLQNATTPLVAGRKAARAGGL